MDLITFTNSERECSITIAQSEHNEIDIIIEDGIKAEFTFQNERDFDDWYYLVKQYLNR